LIKIRFSRVVIKLGNKEIVLVSKPKKEKNKKKNDSAINVCNRLRPES